MDTTSLIAHVHGLPIFVLFPARPERPTTTALGGLIQKQFNSPAKQIGWNLQDPINDFANNDYQPDHAIDVRSVGHGEKTEESASQAYCRGVTAKERSCTEGRF